MTLSEIVKENLNSSNPLPEAEYSVEPIGRHSYRIRLNGRLAPGWIGRLSTGLSNGRINVLRFKAEKVSAMEWAAVLELDYSASAWLPDSTDFAALAAKTVIPRAVEAVRIDTFIVEESPRHGDSLYVEVTGEDRIGFLAALVNMFGMYSLNPAEINIETADNRVFDKFWLKGLGGSAPSASATAAVKDRLAGYSA